MPDITITLGTFNPPAPLAVVHGVLDFPKTPFQQVKRPALQYNSRWVEPDAVVDLPVNVSSSSRDFINGDISVKTSAFTTGAASFVATGVRYVPDDTYLVTGRSSFDSAFYAVSPAIFAAHAGGAVNIGTIEVDPGSVGIEWTASNAHIIVKLAYSMTVVGTGDGSYTTLIFDSRSFSGTVGASGEIRLRIPLATEEIPATGVTRSVNQSVGFKMVLRRNGYECDSIFVSVPIIGTIKILEMPGFGTATPLPVIHGVSLTYHDTLYGAQAVPSGHIPDIPFVAYYRQSIADIGNVTIA